MSDHDPDPIDKAYAQAEAVLSDDEARAARRARVLAAVAETGAEPAARPPARNPAWRHGGWLVAASVAGVSLFLATRIDPPAKFQPPSAPPVAADEAAPEAAPSVSPPSRSAVAPPSSAAPPTPATAARPAQMAPAELAAPAQEPEASHFAGVSEVVVTGSKVQSPSLDTAGPMQLPPPVVARRAERFGPPPPPPPAPLARQDRARAAAPPPSAQASSPGLEELVVTSERRKAAADREVRDRALEAQVARLHAAAAAGRTTELARLLAEGVPIDALDGEGDTALMKSIRARHPDAAAFLRRRGADLDRRNQAGESARDLAADIDDAKLNRALGLDR